MATKRITATPQRTDFDFDDFLAAGYRVRQAPPVQEQPPPEPEKPSVARRIGDTAVQFGQGAVTGVKMMSDIFGANNAVSSGLSDVNQALDGLLSATAQGDKQKVAQIMQEAEGKGWGEQIVAGLKAAGVDPVGLAANALGTSLPTMATMLIPGAGPAAVATRMGAGVAMGAGQGVGAVKGQIYDETKRKWLEARATPEQAEAKAQEAAAYGGENTDQMAIGGVLGMGSVLGAERALGKVLHGASKAGPGMLGRVATSTLAETGTEMLQGGQEKFATNTALNRQGFDVDPMSGVIANATLEGAAAAPMGAVAGIPKPAVATAPGIDPAKEAADTIRATEKVPESGALTKAVNAGVEAKALGVESGGLELAPLVDGAAPEAVTPNGLELVPRPGEQTPEPVDDPVRDQILALPDGARQDALRAYAVVNRDDAAKGVQQYNRKLLDRLLAENQPAPEAAPEIGGVVRNFDPKGQPTNTLSLAPMGKATYDNGIDFQPNAQSELAKRNAELDDLTQRAPRVSTAPVDLSLPTDPVRNYLDNLRGVNTPAARAYVRDFDAGRITPADVQQRMQAEKGKTPDQRIAQAAAEAPAQADPVADRLARAAAQGMATPAPTDILNPAGEPFKTRMAADRAAKKTPGAVVPVEGGFVVRPQESVNVQDVPQAPEVPQAAPAVIPPSQAPQAVGAQPAGPAAGVSAEGAGAVEAAGLTENKVGRKDSAQIAQPENVVSEAGNSSAQPAAPIRIVRDNTPLSEGGKPFKTRKAAGDAKKLQPMMRVVTVPGGYALADKTPAQLAAEAKAAKRLATPRTSARGEPIPAHAFVAAAGGLNPVAASDLGVDGNPRIGNRRLFSGQGRGLSMDQATQMLVADGYLSEGATVNDAFALIKRSLTQPQYNADGIERIAQAEADAQFEDYLAAQEEVAQDDEFDPFGPAPATLDGFSDDMLESSGYDAATDATKAEVRALLEMANAQGIDTESIMLEAHDQTRNATEQDYYEAAKSALEAAITGSNRDRGAPAGSEGQGAGEAAASAAEQGLNQPDAPATLELAAQTPAEAAAQQDAQEQAAKAEAAAKRAADAAAKAEDERKRIAQASVRAADRFELGQGPMDSLTGQGSLLDAQEVGPFGPIFTGLGNQPEAAIEKLMQEQRGEVADAFTHPELGPIAFVYGDKDMGLRHIEAKRGIQWVRRIPDILRNGRLERDPKLPRAYLVQDGDPSGVAVIRLDWDGEQKTWLVTAHPDDKGKWSGVGKTSRTADNESGLVQGSPSQSSPQTDFATTGQAEQPDTPKLTPAEAKSLMAWEDMGQKDGVKTHALTFYESQADKDAKRGRMIVAKVSKGDRSATAWMVDGEDKTFGMLAQAKKLAEEVGMAKAVADGFVEQGATKPTVAAKPAAAATAGAPIEDAGEKIGGARKDRWKERGLNLDDLDAMTEAEGAELATKANVWKPDYDALSEASEPVTAAMVKTIYDQLAARPKKNTPEGRRQYVQMMRIVRDVLTEAKGPEAVRNAYLEIRKRAGLNTMEPQAKTAARELLFSVYKGRSDPFVMNGADLMKVKKMVDDGFPAKAAPWKTRLTVGRREGGSGTTERGIEIYMERSAEVGTPLTREQILDGFYRVSTKDNKTVAFAATKEDAEAAAATVYERDMKGKKDSKPEPVRPNLDELKRENLPQRIDRDVTSEDFVRDLGFRGVEFGNWSAQDERQRILNMAYDGLMDLAEIMGVPPKAMSLNGTLGMAFGARGGGRFAAHYEPGKLVINMTKIRGGGSMAHEWAHAMDHYFGELDKDDAYTTQARGASGWYSEDQYNGVPRKRMERVGNEWKNVEKMRLDNLRPEMAAAFDEVMRALFSKQITKAEMVRSHELDLERTEALARNETQADLKAMYQNMAQNKRQALNELRGDPEGTMYAGRGRSDYASQAQKLSGKSENGYWTRPTEMFARAFESWVFDRVTAMGARSDYLVHGVEEDRFAGGAYKGNPYPTGEERARINAAFDKLAQTIQTKETDKGVALFATASTPVAPGQGITLQAAQQATDKVLDGLGMRGVVVPKVFRNTAAAGISDPGSVMPTGGTSNGEVYLFTDNIHDEADAFKVVFHELFHLGLSQSVKPQEYIQTMLQFLRDPLVRKYANEWKQSKDGRSRLGTLPLNNWHALAVEEALAVIGENLNTDGKGIGTKEMQGWVRRTIAWLADLAQSWKMPAVARKLRGMTYTQAEAFVQATMLKGRTGAPVLLPDTRFRSTTAQSIASSMGDMTPDQERAYKNVAGVKAVPTVRERMDALKANLGLKLRQGLVDQFAAIKQLDQNAYVQARMSKGTDGTLEAMLMYGKPFMRDGAPDVDIKDGGFAKVLASLKGEQDRWMMWIAAQRAEKLKADGKENLMTDDDISALKTLNAGKMADGTARMPIYAKALQELNDYNDAMLKLAMESGLIDQAAYDLMAGQPYVPFYRLMEDGDMKGPKFSSGLTNQKAWQKLKGGTQQLNADLLQNMLLNWSHLLQASAKNRAATATMDAAEKMAVAYKVAADTKGAVKVMRDGSAEHWMVEDPYLLDAISAIHYVPSPLMKPLAKFKQLLTWGVTVNPTFKIRNLIRDSVSAIAQADLGYNPAGNVAKGWKLTAKDSQIYASMLASGGLIKFGTQENTDRLRAQVAKLGGVVLDKSGAERFFGQIKDLYDVYNEFGDRAENVNRAALYDALIKKGKTHAEASFMARDLMDFSMSGSAPVVRFLTQAVPFLNARLVGLDKLGRAAMEDPLRFATVTGAVALASLALLAAYSDDDDWKKREDWDRDAYWWFKVGEQAYRIPKPFEVGAIGTLAERTAELMLSDEMTGKRYMERVSHMLSGTFSFNPVPQAFKPLLDLYANKDSFTGRAIESQADQRLRPQDRYSERTPEVAKFLGGLGLPDPAQLVKGEYSALSPKQVEHLIRGYFSWVGTAAMTVSDFGLRPLAGRGERPDMRLKDVFIAGNFVENLPTGSSRYVTQMYEQARQAEQAYASYQEAIKAGDTDKAQSIKESAGPLLRNRPAYTAATRQLAEINRMAKRIEADQAMAGAAKRARLTQLEQQRHVIAQRVSRLAAATP